MPFKNKKIISAKSYGRQSKDEVVKQKIKFEQKSKEIQFSAARTGKELFVILQTNKSILESNDVMIKNQKMKILDVDQNVWDFQNRCSFWD